MTVTALFDQVSSGNTAYEGVESKPASKAFTTTLLPASESDLGEYGLSSGYNGIQLRIRDNRRYINQETFVSGNTYTLVPDGHNKGAQYYIGALQGETFIPKEHGRFSWADNTCFAPEALIDNKNRQIGWFWLQDNPEDDYNRFAWSGVYGLPREFWYDGGLRMAPIDEPYTSAI